MMQVHVHYSLQSSYSLSSSVRSVVFLIDRAIGNIFYYYFSFLLQLDMSQM